MVLVGETVGSIGTAGLAFAEVVKLGHACTREGGCAVRVCKPTIDTVEHKGTPYGLVKPGRSE